MGHRKSRFNALTFLFSALAGRWDKSKSRNERSDRFHLAGFGADIRGAVSLVAVRHVVVQVEGKLGYINMPDIKTTLNNKPDKASQDFVYGEVDLGIGYTFNTRKYN